jgi:hypothetical protein
MPAMTATPASMLTGRSQWIPAGPATGRRRTFFTCWRRPAGLSCPGAWGWGWVVRAWPTGRGSRRSRGQGRELGPGSELDRMRWAGHAQWPRQTQYRARLKAPLTAASSHG